MGFTFGGQGLVTARAPSISWKTPAPPVLAAWTSIAAEPKYSDPVNHETRDIFSHHDLRCTAQRELIYDALRGCRSHPTAEQLFRLVSDRADSPSLATIYNALEVFCAAGLVRKLQTLNGSSRYDADTSDHLHVEMAGTDELIDVPDALSRRLLDHLPASAIREIESEMGVKVDQVGIQLVCRPARNTGGSLAGRRIDRQPGAADDLPGMG